MSMAFCSAGVRLRPLVPLSYHVQRIYTSHDQAHADKSIPRFSPAAARLILLPKKAAPRDLGRPPATGGVRPSGTAVYLCCLLCATASLTLSTECNCFSTATTAAHTCNTYAAEPPMQTRMKNELQCDQKWRMT